MNLSDKVMDLIMPNSKKKNEIIVDEEQEQKKSKQDNFMESIDRDSLHSLFSF